MDVLLCIVYNGRNYHCREDLMGKRDIIIKLIIDGYIIYRKYIMNFENFLNVDRQHWPKWNEYKNKGLIWVDEVVYIEINKDIIEVYENDKIIYDKKIQKVITPEFIEFINRRFLLEHICNKYNLPKDIQTYLVKFF